MTIVLWWVTCLIWSSVWLFIKLGLRDLPPVSFAAIRLVVAIAVFLPILAIRRSPLPRNARDWYVIGVAGLLLLGVNYALLYWGAQFIPSGLTAVLQAVTPAFALVFGHFLLEDEPFTFKALGAIAVGVAGVALISWDQLHLSGRQALLGCAAVTIGSACVGFAYVFVKGHGGRRLRPEVLTCGQMLCAAGPMLAVRHRPRRQPAEPAMDAARDRVPAVSGAGRFGRRDVAQLLAAGTHVRDSVTIDGAGRAAHRGAARRRPAARAGDARRRRGRRARALQYLHDYDFVPEEPHVKRVHALAVLVLLSMAVVPNAQIVAQTVTLRYHWTKGESRSYRMTTRTDSTITGAPAPPGAPPGPLTVSQSMSQVLKFTADDVTPDGAVTLRQTFQSIRLESSGPMGNVVVDSAAAARGR